MISNKSILEDSEHFNKWLKLTLLPCFKDLKELSERVTAKIT